MRIVEAHHVAEIKHTGYRGFMGINPRIRRTAVENAEYIWYCSWGDSPHIAEDLAKITAFSKNSIPVVSVVLGDQDYSHGLDSEGLKRHFSTTTNNWPYRVPNHYAEYGIVKPARKTVFASFCGTFQTWPPRAKLVELACSDVVIIERNFWIYDHAERCRLAIGYKNLLNSSKFSLCPRGAGPSSIRLMESILSGAVPIMIDDDSRPFGNSMEFALKTSTEKVRDALDAARQMSESEYADRFALMNVFKETYLKIDDRSRCVNTLGYTEYIRQVVCMTDGKPFS